MASRGPSLSCVVWRCMCGVFASEVYRVSPARRAAHVCVPPVGRIWLYVGKWTTPFRDPCGSSRESARVSSVRDHESLRAIRQVMQDTLGRSTARRLLEISFSPRLASPLATKLPCLGALHHCAFLGAMDIIFRRSTLALVLLARPGTLAGASSASRPPGGGGGSGDGNGPSTQRVSLVAGAGTVAAGEGPPSGTFARYSVGNHAW